MATRSLKVAITPGVEKLTTVKGELLAKGHEVHVLSGLSEFDLVLGPNCMRITKATEKLLKIVIKVARQRKYGQKGGKVQESYEVEDI